MAANLILIVLLGCNVNFLMEDRLSTAVNFANNYAFDSNPFIPNSSIDWILSGGIKNPSETNISEAEKMADFIKRHESNDSDWEYYLDDRSTNTAENFVAVKKHINSYKKIGIDYSNVYIVTSGFHYERAKKFADILVPDNHFNWILGTKKELSSDYWEKIHIKNVDSDIIKLFNKFRYVM